MRQLLLLFSVLLVISCNEKSDDPNWSPKNASVEAGYMMDDLELEEVVVEESNQQQQAKQIIKTGNLRFETQDLEASQKRIKELIRKYQGYIQNDNSGKNYNEIYQNLTIRVPTQNFEKLVEGIASGVAYFDEKTISQRDVTEEFVDLNARLKAKRALENRYLELLEKAKTVKEMLEIEGELAQIREEIEAREGRLKYLQSQVSLSTIHLKFYKTTVESKITQSYGSKISNALKSGWNGISQFFLGLLHIWPFLILVTLGGIFTRRWLKKRKKK